MLWSVDLSQHQQSLLQDFPVQIIHLSIHLWSMKPFIMRPGTSINYSDGRRHEERQIRFDLIGKQVCSGLLSTFVCTMVQKREKM